MTETVNIALGMDVSTSCTALVLVQLTHPFVPEQHFLHYDPIEFVGCDDFWQKCDRVVEHINAIKGAIRQIELAKSVSYNVSSIFVEEPLKRFAEGFSSAETVCTLQRMNGICCYVARCALGVDPTYVNVSSARKAAGVHVVSKARAGGLSAKEQTFKHMQEHDLSHVIWPMTKGTKRSAPRIKPFAYDVCDAYVAARGGALITSM